MKQLTVAAIALIGLSGGLVASAVGAEPQVAGLSKQDRDFITEQLGADFLGEAIAPLTIGPAKQFAGLVDGATWVFQDVVKNKPWEFTFSDVDGAPEAGAWRIDYSNGDVRLGEFDEAGNALSNSLKDAKEGAITQMTPSELYVVAGLELGRPQSQRLDIKMVEADNPDKLKYEGYLNVTYEYIGAHKVTVPAGTFDAAITKWTYEGMVGPAKIKDQQYYFFAEGVGPVALIENKKIVAMVVYRKSKRLTGVLLERR
jgi:hypothetical protein